MKVTDEMLKTWNRFFGNLAVIIATFNVITPISTGRWQPRLILFGTIVTIITLAIATLIASYLKEGEK